MNLTYEILENGYVIKDNGVAWIEQVEPFIPDRTKSYEENAIAQIEELQQAQLKQAQEKTELEQLQEQVTDLQLALAELVEGGM